MSASRIGTAEPCAPRAEVGGDVAAVEQVTGELVRLGVTVAAAAPGCPVLKAVVELARDGGIAVAVRGAAQRSEGRIVSDAALAAVWIDSWLRDDLDGWTAPPDRVAAVDPVAQAMPLAPPGDGAVVAPRRLMLEDVALSASYERAWTEDGSAWTGGNLAACVRVGAICLGARARASFEPELTAGITAASRSDVSLLATASIPIDVGQFFVAPEVGVGVGRFTTTRIEGCKSMEMPPKNCDPSDPMCIEPPPVGCEPTTGTNGLVYVGDDLDEASYTPRVALALRVAVPLFKHVWLDGLASITLAPFGHRDAYGESPNAMGTGAFAIPGEPSRSVQLGIGLRVGAP